VHAGFIDTDMAANVHEQKISPETIFQQTLDALEVGRREVFNDAATRQLKSNTCPSTNLPSTRHCRPAGTTTIRLDEHTTPVRVISRLLAAPRHRYSHRLLPFAVLRPPLSGSESREIQIPCPIGHQVDISLENWTSNLRSHTGRDRLSIRW
jgi:hypothetical protein